MSKDIALREIAVRRKPLVDCGGRIAQSSVQMSYDGSHVIAGEVPAISRQFQ